MYRMKDGERERERERERIGKIGTVKSLTRMKE